MGNSSSVDDKKGGVSAVSPKSTKNSSFKMLTGMSKSKTDKTKVTTKAKTRTMDLTLRGREEKKLYQFAAFSPAIAHWELANNADAAVGVTVKPCCWSFDTALLFVDISGFTNLSTRLEVDALQRHINLYFTALIDVIVAHGGDVLRFAGDAIICSWSLSPLFKNDKRILGLAALAACRCALDLNQRCAIYHIPEVDSTLKIHSGIGVGGIHAFRVGSASHWEFFVAGDAVFQYAKAESCAEAGDAVCSPETWALCGDELEGTVLENGCILLKNYDLDETSNLKPLSSVVIDEELKQALSAHEQLLRQRAGTAAANRVNRATTTASLAGGPMLAASRQKSYASVRSIDIGDSSQPPGMARRNSNSSIGSSGGNLDNPLHGGHLAPLKAYTHKVARSAVEQDVLRDIAEQRSVVVSFALIEGIDQALLAGIDGLDSVQACMEASLRAIEARGGMLRQFIRDDKGAVVIWSYGLTQQAFLDSPERGLRTALDVIADLKALGLQPRVGVTSGTAYCGLVGASYRCEYALMGPAVNLAARLMCKCEKLNVELLCNDELHDKFLSGDSDAFDFEGFPPMQVKGYTNPVTFYHPILKEEYQPSQRKSSGNVSSFIRRHTHSTRPSHSSVGGVSVENGGFPPVDSLSNSKSGTPSRDERTKSPPRMVKHLLGFKPSPRKSSGAGIRNSDGSTSKASSPHGNRLSAQGANSAANSSMLSGNQLSSTGDKSQRGSKSGVGRNISPPRRSEGLRQHVLSHLDALSLGHQMILKTASAIGVVFDRSVLINTYPGSAAEADEALSTTLSTFVMRLEGDTQHDVRFAFRSAATASVIYDLMLQAQKKRLHKQIAAWYERVRVLRRREGLRTEEDLVAPLALHYLLSGDEERAKKLFIAAGRLSCAQGRYLEAVSHFDACLNLFTTRNGDDDDDMFCEVLVWLAQTVVRYGIPYKAPAFIGDINDDDANEKEGKSAVPKKLEISSSSSRHAAYNSVKCAEKLLQRAFAVLNGRIMRRVVARFSSAQLSSAMDRWRINVSMLSSRENRESFNGGGTGLIGYRRGSGNPRMVHQSGRSNSLTHHSSSFSTFLSTPEQGHHEINGEDKAVFLKRRLQVARVKAQLAWVLAADPERCLKEGEQIKSLFLEAIAVQEKNAKFLEAADSLNGLGCYYHKRAVLASPAVTAATLKEEKKRAQQERSKLALKEMTNDNVTMMENNKVSTGMKKKGGVSLFDSASFGESSLLNKKTISSSDVAQRTGAVGSNRQTMDVSMKNATGGNSLSLVAVAQANTEELKDSTTDINEQDLLMSQSEQQQPSSRQLIERTESAEEMDEAYLKDRSIHVQKAVTEKDEWLELAAQVYHRSLAMRDKLKVSHALAQSFTSLGRLQCDLGETVLGIEIFTAAVEQYFLTVGPHHPKVASSLEALAAAYSRTKDPLMALGLRAQADAIREKQALTDAIIDPQSSPRSGGGVDYSHGMVFDSKQDGDHYTSGGIRNSISNRPLNLNSLPVYTVEQEELLPWETSGVTGPQGAWAQGFRPQGAIKYKVISPNHISVVPSTPPSESSPLPLPALESAAADSVKSSSSSSASSSTSGVAPGSMNLTKKTKAAKNSGGNNDTSRQSKDWGTSNSDAPRGVTEIETTAGLFNNNVSKLPSPKASLSNRTSPPRLKKHASSKSSRRFSDAEVLSLYTQEIDETPRPWLANSLVESASEPTSGLVPEGATTPPQPPITGAATATAASLPPAPPSTIPPAPLAPKDSLDLPVPLETNAVMFCLKVVKGDVKGLAGMALRKQLEKLYPELTYFIGPSVQISGRLANKTTMIQAEVIQAMTWALKLADPNASSEKLGKLIRNKLLQMDEPCEEWKDSKSKKSDVGSGGNRGSKNVLFSSEPRGSSSRSNSGSRSPSMDARASSSSRNKSPDKSKGDLNNSKSSKSSKGTSLDSSKSELSSKDQEKLYIEKRAARALDGVLSMLALSSLGKIACLLGDIDLVPGDGGAGTPLTPAQFAKQALVSIQKDFLATDMGTFENAPPTHSAFGDSSYDPFKAKVILPTMERHLKAAQSAERKLISKSSSSSSSSNSSSKFSSSRSMKSSSSMRKQSMKDSTSSTKEQASPNPTTTLKHFKLVKCLATSIDVKSIISGESPASSLLPLEVCPLRLPSPQISPTQGIGTTGSSSGGSLYIKPIKSGTLRDSKSPSRSALKKDKDQRDSTGSGASSVANALNQLSLFGIPQLIFHDVMLAFAPTLAEGYLLSSNCTSPFDEPVELLQHTTSMAYAVIESLLAFTTPDPNVTAKSVYADLITKACRRLSMPSVEEGGMALCRIECMLTNSSIIENIRIWKSSDLFAAYNKRPISLKEQVDAEEDDHDWLDKVKTLLSSLVSNAIAEIDINDRKYLVHELSLSGCNVVLNSPLAATASNKEGSTDENWDVRDDLTSEAHNAEVPLQLIGASDMLKVIMNAVLEKPLDNPSQINLAKKAVAVSPTVVRSKHSENALVVLAAGLEQLSSILRSSRHEIVTHQKSNSSTSPYLTDRVVSTAPAAYKMGSPKDGKIDETKSNTSNKRSSGKNNINLSVTVASNQQNNSSGGSIASLPPLEDSVITWQQLSNPYPVNCSSMVKCCALHVSTHGDHAERLMFGLKSSRYAISSAKPDGAYAIVVAYDKAIQPVAHLLPKPPAGTKPIDRVRAAINLPPLASSANSEHRQRQSAAAVAALSDDMSVSSRSSHGSRRPSAAVRDAIMTENEMYPATPTVIFTSPGRGQGSEMVMVLARALVDLGILDLKGVVANLAPTEERAKLVRGTLDVLGLESVPVAVGMTPGVQKSGAKAKSAEFNVEVKAPGYDYMKREPDYADGQEMLLNIYEHAEDFSVALLCISALTDVAQFICDHRDLFAVKTQRIVLMGGVDESTIAPRPHVDGLKDFLLPDASAQNNQYDWDASEIVHKACQELGIQLVVSTRVAAYASAVPAFIYDELASIGHPVALRLRSTQEKSITGLWRRASLPAGHADRRGLPDRCDRKWFAKSFCGGADLSGVAADTPSIWSQVSAFNMYDPLALLMVDDRTSQAFFEPESKVVLGVDHLIVGVEKIPLAHDAAVVVSPNGRDPNQEGGGAKGGSSGIRDVKALRDFLMDASRLGLLAAMPRAKYFRSESFKTPFREKNFLENPSK